MSNCIELRDRKTGDISLLTLYRVMSVRHMDRPNQDAEFTAELRECLTTNEKSCLSGERVDRVVIVPSVLKGVIFEAFNRDVDILAQVVEGCIQSAIVVPPPTRFNSVEYVSKYGKQT
jgi:hypothetical protein